MIGQTQEAWLYDGLARSQSRWHVIAQDVLMARFRQKTPDGSFGYWTDDWDGYPASRTRLIRKLQEARISNPVILSGDIHSFWANDLLLDFDNPKSGIVATEFVGTSISAHGPEYDRFARSLSDNPHVHFFEIRVRGYALVDIRHGAMTTSFRAISEPTKPDATVSTLKTFVVEDGRPGALSA